MAKIAGGKVSYLRRVQAAQFEPKEVTVELTFSVDEGDTEETAQATFDRVAEMAVAKVHTMLGIDVKVKPKLTVVPKETPAATQAVALAAVAEAVAEPIADDEIPAFLPAGRSHVDDTGAQKLADQARWEAEAKSAEPAKVITDLDLTTACSHKNGILKDPLKIRTLVGKFAGPGKSTSAIPQGQRQNFLDELKGL